MYALSTSDWYSRNMDTQGIAIITYRQQTSFQYQYLIGSFGDDFTIENDTENVDLIQLDWNQFNSLIDKNKNISQLYITQWSKANCNNSLQLCFNQYFPTQSTYYYTLITNEWYFDINSEEVSNAYVVYHLYTYKYMYSLYTLYIRIHSLDDPRDGIHFIVLLALFAITILLLTAIPDFGNAHFFWTAMIFIGAYYLWIFVLTVVPIQFALPYNKQGLDYWNMIRFSLVFSVGNYKPIWWILGVILNGLWMYTLLLFLPCLCCFFILIVACLECCFACCCEKRADDIGLWILIALIIIGICSLCLMTLGYIIIFFGNLSMWNAETYNGFDDIFVIQALIALICIWILFPMFGCIVSANAKKRDQERIEMKKKKAMSKKMQKFNSISNTFKNLPVIRSKLSNEYENDEEVHNDQEIVAMTKHNDENGTQQKYIINA